jgi:tetratricopeptide (TPR) repeat protein
MNFHEKTWQDKAFDFANQGISLSMLRQLKAAAFSWAAAAELASQHLQGSDFYYWVMGGYGKALLDCQCYDEAIEFAELAYKWEVSIKQPASTLTIAHALMAQGKLDAAKPFLRSCHTLIGDKIYKQFPELEREILLSLLQDGEKKPIASCRPQFD